ncbi:MAG TPA: hypothetical protein VGV59_09810 [Pyrinomonadaceae bacterium]|nr:hypothetical protein [Pyrinomonadaceae bacterium]
MLRFTPPFSTRTAAATLCAGLLALAHVAHAQQKAQTPAQKLPVVQQTKDEDAPPYREFKGVRIGMTCDEARKLLGDPADKGDAQDFYVFSETETAQVFYDKEKKVFAVAAVYLNGTANGVPTPKAVLGSEIEPKPDGSLHKMVTYPKAGYWVSYSRTSGDSPLVTVTMQKRQ